VLSIATRNHRDIIEAMNTTNQQDKIAHLERRIDMLERMVRRFVPVDDEGEYTDKFKKKLDESDKDIAEGNLTEIESLDDLKA
jgi:hypothetical protein